MNSRRAAYWVVAVLFLIGAVLVGLRLYSRQHVRMMQGETTWRLTYHISFRAPRAGTKIRIASPSDDVHSRMFRQDLRFSGLDRDRVRPSHTDTRELSMSTERDGEFRLACRFDIHLSPKRTFRTRNVPAVLTVEERAQYLRSTKSIQAESPLVVQAVQGFQLTPSTKAELVQKIFDYCQNEIALGDASAPSDAAGVLEKKVATPLGRARAMVALCRAAKIPARLVTGFDIRQGGDVKPHVWTEVLWNRHWDPYDPDNGFSHEMPHNFVVARRGGAEIVHASDVSDLHTSYTLIPIPPPSGSLGRKSRTPLAILDLTRLPLEEHEVLVIILLMPLGALLTSFFRTLVGIRTYGTFTPTLLALAFCFADWRTGLMIFFVVVCLGLVARSLLDRLKLLMVPRLSVILTLVAVFIIFAVSLLDYIGVTPSGQAVLLPMVILTMTIERFYVTAEEDGLRFAVQLLIGTVAIGFFCYLILRWQMVGSLLLIYPEVHFFTVGLLILMGRYTGYRLSELWRFRDFGNAG